MATHSSTLAWKKSPVDGGAWQAAVHGVAESWTRLSDFTFTFHFHALEKEMATHSSVLAWRIPGTGEPVGCRLWGHAVSDMTEVTQQQQQQQLQAQQRLCTDYKNCIDFLTEFFSLQHEKLLCTLPSNFVSQVNHRKGVLILTPICFLTDMLRNICIITSQIKPNRNQKLTSKGKFF